MPFPRAARLCWTLIVVLGCVRLAAEPAKPAGSYAELVAAAERHRAEQSWALARDHFAAAVAQAPDAERRRWVELWLQEVAWQADEPPWHERKAWAKRHTDAFAALGQPYAEGRPRDAFWRAWQERRIEFLETLGHQEVSALHAELADEFGAQPPTPAALREHLGFLRRTFGAVGGTLEGWPGATRLQPHLERALEKAVQPDDRAWCAWQLARIAPGGPNPDAAAYQQAMRERDALWRRAQELATGTRWEAAVRADDFHWRTRMGWASDAADGPPNHASLIDQATRLRYDVLASPAEYRGNLDTVLQALIEAMSRPILQLLFENGARFLPGEEVKFAYGAAGFESVEFTLVRRDAEAWAQLQAGKQSPPTEVIRTWTVATGPARQRRWHSEVVDLGRELPRGFYSLRVMGHGAVARQSETISIPWGTVAEREGTERRDFVVSAAHGVAFSASVGDSTEMFVSGPDGKPMPGAAAAGYTWMAAGERGEGFAWTGTADASGRVVFPSRPGRSGVAAVVGGEPVSFTGYSPYRPVVEPLEFDLFVDRPLHRPGEVVRWKVIARERQADRLVAPRGREFDVRVQLDDEPLGEPTKLVLNDYGTAHGEIQIPVGARPGQVHLELAENDDTHLLELTQVDNFVPPPAVARIELASDANSLRPGGEVVVRVLASYFSGGPVSGAPASITFMSSDPRSWREEDDIEEPADALRPTSFTGTTDANGVAEFRLRLPNGVPDGSQLLVAAGVVPPGAVNAGTSASYVVSKAGVSVKPDGWDRLGYVSPGAEVGFAAEVRDGARRAAPFAGEIALVERRWAEAWLGPGGEVVDAPGYREAVRRSTGDLSALHRRYAGGGTPELPGWRKLHAGYVDVPVESIAVTAGAEGRIAARFRVPRAGLFEVRVVADGTRVPVNRSAPTNPDAGDYSFPRMDAEPEMRVLAADADTASLPVDPNMTELAWPFGREPARGAQVLGILEEGAMTVWLSRADEAGSHTRAVSPSGRLVWIEAQPPNPGASKVCHLTLSNVDSGGWLRSKQTSFRLVSEDRVLRVAITPDAAESRPGQPARVGIQVTDRAGRPRQAELALSVADDSVVRLVREGAPPQPVFLGDGREHRIETETATFGWTRGGRQIRTLFDPRPGQRLAHVAGYHQGGDGEVLLESFSVAAGGSGYAAMGSANRRVMMADSASAANASAVIVRRHFASTAHWSPAIVTGADGRAEAAFTYPDNLTQWRVGAYVVGADGVSFARAHAFTRTSLPLQARLNLPRFAVAGDSFEASATLVNRTAAELRAEAKLTVTGPVEPAAGHATTASLVAPAHQEARAGWTVVARAPGRAEFTLEARAAKEADAMALALPVHEDGLQQETAATARLGASAERVSFNLELPARLEPARTTVRVQLGASHAATILDAVPYLVDYPHGCVEQTMSRFLPAIVTRQTLQDLGFTAEEIERRIMRREGAGDARRRAATAGLSRLDEVVQLGLGRLREAMDQGNGGFGWWPGDQQADLWMTAYVAWGLVLAAEAEVKVPEEMMVETFEALDGMIAAGSPNLDAMAFALAAMARLPDAASSDIATNARGRFAALYLQRSKLSASGRACLALAALAFGDSDSPGVLLRNLESSVVRAESRDVGATAHWGATRDYWRAMDGAVESTALALLALLALDPEHPLVEPAVNWLALNRRSSRWASTRDTAFAVLALNAYVASREDVDGERELEVRINGRALPAVKLDRAALLAGPAELAVPGDTLRGGANRIEVRRVRGPGAAYAVAFSSAWATSDVVRPQGGTLQVGREFVRQKPEPTILGAVRLVPNPLPTGGTVQAGEQVTASVTLQVAYELEYLMVEVPKPAGCEPLNALSGWDARIFAVDAAGKVAAEGRPVYREEHDDRSVFFLGRAERGRWEIRFGLRATTVGDFRALPPQVSAMYVPEIRANGDARRLVVERADPVDGR